MLTIKAEVLKSKQKVDKTYNVKIRLTYSREVKRLATHIFVRAEDLTKDFKLKNPSTSRKLTDWSDTMKSYVWGFHWRLPI